MPENTLTPEARHENATMLASILGLALPEADEALQFDVAVTASSDDHNAIALANELVALLCRTVRAVALNAPSENAVIEVIIGNADPRGRGKRLFVAMTADGFAIRPEPSALKCDHVTGILNVLIACYVSAAVMHGIFGERLPFSMPTPLRVSFAELGVVKSDLEKPIDIGRAYLAGAGAVGNGFLWAARYLDLHGQLDIADDDRVSSGNLNRQIWFSRDDIDKPKAERLALRAQNWFPHLKLVPRHQRLQDLAEKSDGPWLERLLVGVDSRRARRKLQNEFPGEVFDASTTDIREVVVHHHKQVTAHACMSCIYEADAEETSREAHIAQHLGVSVAEVRQERISPTSASRIIERCPQLRSDEIVGVAYDTLFKQLCGANELKSIEGRRVVAPFAFVSILAGTLLAFEVVRRLSPNGSEIKDNYWRASPWYPPLARRRICRPKQPKCEFCGDPILAAVNAQLWSAEPLDA